MSRYTLFKNSYEQIKHRPATKTEKKLLVALMMLAKAYDENYLELSEVKKACKKAYGSDFLRQMFNASEERELEFLWTIPREKRELAERYINLDYMEKQIYYVSKTMRKAIGIEVIKRELNRIPKNKTRRETAKKQGRGEE